MEPKNFSSPDANEKSREARLNQLRERRSKAVASNGAVSSNGNLTGRSMANSNEVAPRPRSIAADSKPRLVRSEPMRSPEPIIDNRFDNRLESRGVESKVKPLPNRQPSNRQPSDRQDRIASQPDQRTDLRPTDLKTRRKSNVPNKRPIAAKSSAKSLGWQMLRLAIAGIGLSVIAGTAISFWQNQQSSRAKAIAAKLVAKEDVTKTNRDITSLSLKTEATSLLTKIKELAATEKDLGMQMMVVELDSGAFVQVGGSQVIAAASTIKTPILVAFLQDVDAGKIKLDEQLEMTADVKVGEAGDLQYLPTGTKISALETATKMIVISDNTATNMIIKRLGGNVALNQRFKSWGLTATVINNQLPDLEGTNTITTQDLVTLLSMIDLGKLVEPRSRDRFMDIMRRPITNTLLPRGIPDEARIIHKTGDIASTVGDAGIVDMPNGKRYAIAVMVKRPDNDQRANELIRQISRATYEYFRAGGTLPANNNSASPVNSPTPTNSADTANPPNPNNRGTSTIENIPLPLPNASPSVSPSASPTTLPTSPLTRQNQ
ncbi:MAG: serine hydrolase [Pseudanabaena sp. ELA645]